MRAHPHRRSPCPHATRCNHLQRTESLQSVGEFTECAPRNPREWEDLAAMRVPAQLKAYTGLLHNWKPRRHMLKENARGAILQVEARQNVPQPHWVIRYLVGYARNLQPIHNDALAVQHAKPAPPQRFRVMGRAAEFLVIPRYKKNTERRREGEEGFRNLVGVGFGAVKEVARNKDHIRRQAPRQRSDPLR